MKVYLRNSTAFVLMVKVGGSDRRLCLNVLFCDFQICEGAKRVMITSYCFYSCTRYSTCTVYVRVVHVLVGLTYSSNHQPPRLIFYFFEYQDWLRLIKRGCQNGAARNFIVFSHDLRLLQ